MGVKKVMKVRYCYEINNNGMQRNEWFLVWVTVTALVYRNRLCMCAIHCSIFHGLKCPYYEIMAIKIHRAVYALLQIRYFVSWFAFKPYAQRTLAYTAFQTNYHTYTYK